MEAVTVFALILLNSITPEGAIVYTLQTDPVEMTVEECITLADEINNNPDLPVVMVCMPKIHPAGLPT